MSKLNLIAEPGSHAIVMTREFAAPRDLVFRTFTDPALVPRWWGWRTSTTTVDQMEVRMGGLWRFVSHGAEGEFAFRGVYHEVRPPERLVYTFEYEGMPGHILLETVAFEERDGRTLVTDTAVYQSVEDRDGMLQTGMEEGAGETWDRFEELLKTV